MNFCAVICLVLMRLFGRASYLHAQPQGSRKTMKLKELQLVLRGRMRIVWGECFFFHYQLHLFPSATKFCQQDCSCYNCWQLSAHSRKSWVTLIRYDGLLLTVPDNLNITSLFHFFKKVIFFFFFFPCWYGLWSKCSYVSYSDSEFIGF